MAEEEEASQEKSFKLLGILDVYKVPCSREAILHGAAGSAVTGILYFLATGRGRMSCHVGFAGYMVTSLGSWFYCRIKNAKQRAERRMVMSGIRNMIMYQGTDLDPTRKKKPYTPPGSS